MSSPDQWGEEESHKNFRELVDWMKERYDSDVIVLPAESSSREYETDVELVFSGGRLQPIAAVLTVTEVETRYREYPPGNISSSERRRIISTHKVSIP